MVLLKSSQRRLNTQREIINHFSRLIPSFNELFDEQSWYIFFACLTISAFIVAFILSLFLNLNYADYVNKNRRANPFANVRRTRLL
jgi:hypothetical protein